MDTEINGFKIVETFPENDASKMFERHHFTIHDNSLSMNKYNSDYQVLSTCLRCFVSIKYKFKIIEI